MSNSAGGPSFGHVLAMTDRYGMFEHADHAAARHEHGYCTDDVARLLIVVVREPMIGRAVNDLGRTAMRFLAESQGVTGRTRNRRATGGRWHGRRGVEDCWGRSMWAFGSAARLAPDDWMRSSALAHFNHGSAQRSPHRRAMAFAALGAAQILVLDPRHSRARALLSDAIDSIGVVPYDPLWTWPEARLSYANAALAEVLIAGGHLLERPGVLEDGLRMLGWLLERETLDGHLSPTPVGGSGPGDRAPMFDQQPIEVAAMADAAVRALDITGDAAWNAGIERCIDWFGGLNDLGAEMWDPTTGGGFDGLTPLGPNLNQGAESTLALISTLQHGARRANLAGAALTAV